MLLLPVALGVASQVSQAKDLLPLTLFGGALLASILPPLLLGPR